MKTNQIKYSQKNYKINENFSIKKCKYNKYLNNFNQLIKNQKYLFNVGKKLNCFSNIIIRFLTFIRSLNSKYSIWKEITKN